MLDGRLYIEGVDCLSARDVYTGKVLWKRRFNCLDTYNTYYTVSYEIDPLFQGYNQIHFPGANARGTNYVVTDDTVYFLSDRDRTMNLFVYDTKTKTTSKVTDFTEYDIKFSLLKWWRNLVLNDLNSCTISNHLSILF